jgi:hypothetical protein
MNIDTTKIKQSGYDILKLSYELNEIIENLYSKINNMPVLTGEWVGASAQLFAKQANNVEKKDAIAIKDTLKKFGEELIASAERYDTEIRKNI